MTFDINKVMSSLGMESYIGEEHLTEEQEMLNEIALEAELDQAFADIDGAAIVDVMSKVDLINCGLAEREIALECNEGRDAATIYAEFGLEAIKDVAARHAYTGIASIKSLINTVISWLKNLVGVHTSSKKIFTGLSKKLKDENKKLAKYAAKDMSKLKREMPKFDTFITTLSGEWKYLTDKNTLASVENQVVNLENNLSKVGDKNIAAHDTRLETLESRAEKFKEAFDKSDKEEHEGAACFNFIRKTIANMQKYVDANKGSDHSKQLSKFIDRLQKVNNDLHKNANITPDKLTLVRSVVSKFITRMNKETSHSKLVLKKTIEVADDIITTARGIQAAL